MSGINQFFWVSGLAPIDVTSWTYPVEVVEGLDTGLAFGANSYIYESPMDEIDVGLGIVGGSLVNTLITHVQPNDDGLDTSFAVTGGSLINTLVTHVQPNDDGLDTSLAIIGSSSLVVALIVHNQPNEDGFDVAFAITSGTLV